MRATIQPPSLSFNIVRSFTLVTATHSSNTNIVSGIFFATVYIRCSLDGRRLMRTNVCTSYLQSDAVLPVIAYRNTGIQKYRNTYCIGASFCRTLFL